jgi:protein-S-isoprenylcysteine O-methyltransferase Ste14
MHLLDQRTLGISMLLLLGLLVIIKQVATGAILEKPKGNFRIWLVNTFNLFFLLIANPVAAILLITRRLEVVDPTRLALDNPWLVLGLEIGGLGLYGLGYLLMAWALIRLGGNYQVGGSPPRGADELVVAGPYRLMRHPMYTAALAISLGLAGLIQSLAYFAVFWIYLVLILLLIPVEEEGLRRAYGEQYIAYQQKVSKLVPLVY